MCFVKVSLNPSALACSVPSDRYALTLVSLSSLGSSKPSKQGALTKDALQDISPR